MDETTSPGQRADAVMAGQFGVITLGQALECGLTIDQIRWRLRTHRWERAGRETYVSPAAPPGWRKKLMVACLAGPPGTVASHSSAAALLGVLEPPRAPEITVPAGTSGRSAGAKVYRRALAEKDRTTVGPIPSVTPARMLADCAERLRPRALEDLVDDVLFQKLCSAAQVDEGIGRWGTVGRKGMGRLLKTLEVWAPGPHPGSQAEMRLIRRLCDEGAGLPERQVKIFDKHGEFVARIDCGWRPARVGFEYFGGRHHGPRATPVDLARLRRIKEAGWEVKVVRKEDISGGAAQLYRWLAPRLAAARADRGARAHG